MNWISVEDELPEFDETVLLHNKKAPLKAQECFTGYLEAIKGGGPFFVAFYHRDEIKVTHWMPLPKPPK